MYIDEDDLNIIARVKNAMSASPAWDARGFLQIHVDKWVSLDTAAKNSPMESGLYALCLSEGIRYDKADSRIAYLGSAKNLRSRLGHHKRHPHNNVIELLRQHLQDSVQVTWWTIPRFNRRFLYGVEGEALRIFEETFGLLPIGNLDVPEFIEGQEYCRGLARVSPCRVAKPVALETLAQQFDRVLVRTEHEPIGGGVVIQLEGDAFEAPRPQFKMALFLTRQQAESRTRWKDEQTPPHEYAEELKLLELSLTHDVNIAMWSITKMQQIIRLCRKLKPKSTKAKVMMPFEAPIRDVPVPHTWGEVALVQARIVGGSWQPGKQIWIKVLYGKELLGEGKLNKDYYGEDKSDLPQRSTRRPRCRKHDEDETSEVFEEVEEIEEIEEIYGLEISTWRPAVAVTEKHIEDQLQQEREAVWQTVENLYQQAMAGMD